MNSQREPRHSANRGSLDRGLRFAAACLVAFGLAAGLPTLTRGLPPPAPSSLVLPATQDAFLRRAPRNTNEGGNPALILRGAGPSRVIVGFDLAGVPLASVQKATLVLTIAKNDRGWGGGRAVAAHPLLAPFAEGNGKSLEVPGGQRTRGTGSGATWECGVDTNITNRRTDCATQWDGGSFGSISDEITVTNSSVGNLEWDVTDDVVLGGASAWLVSKSQEVPGGRLRFFSREGAAAAGTPNLAPRLVLEVSGGPTPTFTPPAGPTPTFTPPAGPTPTFTPPAGPTPTFTPPAGPTPTFTPPAGPTPTFTPPAGPTPTFTPPAGPTPTATNQPPVAGTDDYSAVGNTLLAVGTSAGGVPAVTISGSVLDDDSDPDGGPSPLLVTGVSGVTAGAAVNMDASGHFTYLPKVGFTGLDSFTYSVSDGLATTNGTVNVTVAERVWYVDDAAAPGGDGRANAPFQSLAPVNGAGDVDGSGDVIYLAEGNAAYTGGLTLEASQKLVGEGVALVVSSVTLVPAGGRPTLTNGAGFALTVSSSNSARGLNLSGPKGVTGAAIGSLTADHMAIQATAGPAVVLSGGSLAVTLDSASAAAGTTGIDLSTTTGSFAVTGSGAVAASGGTISGMSGDGVRLSSATNVSLSNMDIQDNQGSGVWGDAVTTLTLTGCRVKRNANTTGGSEAGLRFGTLNGLIQLTNSEVSGSFEDNIRWTPSTGTATLKIDGSLIRDNPVGTGGNGITIIGSGTANATLQMATSQIRAHQASGLLTSFTGTASQNISVTTTQVANNNVGIDLGADASSPMTFNIANNTQVSGQNLAGIQVLTASTSVAACQVRGTIANNAVGDATLGSGSQLGSGIRLDIRGAAAAVVAITGNTVQHTDKEGINVQSELGAALLDLTLRNNVVGAPDDDELVGFPVNPFGILVQSRQTSSLCLDVAANTSAGAGTGTGYRVRQRDTSTFRLERFAGSGTSVTDVNTFVTAQNTVGTATQTTIATTFTGVADGFCRTP